MEYKGILSDTAKRHAHALLTTLKGEQNAKDEDQERRQKALQVPG